MEEQRRTEKLTVLVRWVVAAAFAVMLSDAASWTMIGLGLAFVGAYTSALLWAASVPERYAAWSRGLRAFVCAGDVLAISLALVASHGSVPHLHLLYILPIVWAGYRATRPAEIVLATGTSLAGNLGAALAARFAFGMAGDWKSALASSLALVGAAGLASVLFMFKKREDAMQRRDRKLSSLLEFGTRFTSGEDAARLMEQTLRAALSDTDATSGYIMLVDAQSGDLMTEVAVCLGEERPFPKQRRIGEDIEGYVAQTGKPLVLAHEVEGARTPDTVAPAGLRYDGEAVLCVPMVEGGANADQNNVIGVFTLFKHRRGSRFLTEDVDLARTVVGLVTMALVNARLYENQQASFLRSLQALANTLDAKDPYTRGHSYRVSELCVMLARKLNIAPEMVEDMRNGALLHDIGKIGVPDDILGKPEKLTDEEFAIMKQHPVIGFEICRPLGMNDGILMLVRNHHEKLDGTGYPDGLRLGELPLPLRIICAADAFDAMSSSRPYRKIIDSRIRNEQLNRFAGTQFDPIIIEALKSLLQNGELDDLYKDHWRASTDDSPVETPIAKAA